MFFTFCNFNFFSFYSDLFFFVFFFLSILIFFFILSLMKTKNQKYLNFFIFFISFFFFLATKIFLFVVLFETVLIPIIILIMSWGYQFERVQASFFLMLYTLMCSLPSLSFILMGLEKMNSQSFQLKFNLNLNILESIFLTLIFLVKFPIFFFHLWLPKAHVEAPTDGSMQLAGVLLKLGVYGFIRFQNFWNFKFSKIVMIIFSMCFFFCSCLTFFQSDSKMLIAYNSVTHMNFLFVCLLGMYLNSLGTSSILSFTHGITASSLFFIVGFFYSETKTRKIYFFQMISLLFMLDFFNIVLNTMANLGIPPLLGSFSEFSLVYGFLAKGSKFLLFLYLSFIMNSVYNFYLMISFLAGKTSKQKKMFSFLSFNIFIFSFFSLNLFLLFLL